jgi:hypothetical protein
LGKKYDIAACLTIEAAELLYKHNIASVVTDGKNVQIEKEQ